MKKINVIGLGCGNIESLTLGAVEKIKSGNKNILRTKNHPTVEYFYENKVDFTSMDYIYETEDNFDDVYDKIVSALFYELEYNDEINYIVPGHPMVAEKTVSILLQRASLKSVEINIVPSESFIEPLLASLKIDPIDGIKIIDALELKTTHIDINFNHIICQVYNMRVASEVKLILSEIYGDEYDVYLVHYAGVKGKELIEKIKVMEIDKSKNIGALTSLVVLKVDKEKNPIYDFNDLVNIVAQLRSKDGCPWDRAQDHFTLRENLIEESYEVIEAIEEEDYDHLAEELGDLILQVLLHTQIAYENGYFTLIDVTSSLANKLITRHPHIFLKKTLVNTEKVVYNWNMIKYGSRSIDTLSGRMENIPRLPALLRSKKIQNLASEIGFDWIDIEGPIKKVLEEYNELLELIENGEKNTLKYEDELGDLLFSVVNLARFLKVNPEIALHKATDKFISRFRVVEELAKEKDRNLLEMNIEELDELWDQAKTRLDDTTK
ncbi:MAG: nucleoside triphosphate pyrophosphohydrolase [Tissierellales bacterium]|nr:nucleoside triphosphate pyrophosphohydrolase [Tissierellales bacterium]